MIEEMKEVINEEVLPLLGHLTKSNSQITLWQRPIDDVKRISQKAILVKINEHHNELEFLSKRGEFRFSSKLPLYLVSANRMIILKSFIIYNSLQKLVIKIPSLLMLKNSRQNPRQNYAGKEVYIEYSHGTEKDFSHDYKFHKAKLLDLGSQGLSFKSSKNNIIRFNKGDKIFIRSDEEGLMSEITGHVLYVDKDLSKAKADNYYRIGITF